MTNGHVPRQNSVNLEGKGDLAIYYRILCEELGTHGGQEEATLNNYTYQLPWRDRLPPWLSCSEGSAGRALRSQCSSNSLRRT